MNPMPAPPTKPALRRRRRPGWRSAGAVGGANVLIALLVIGIGFARDILHLEDGLVTIVGLLLLGGPPVAIAFRLARATTDMASLALVEPEDEEPEQPGPPRRKRA